MAALARRGESAHPLEMTSTMAGFARSSHPMPSRASAFRRSKAPGALASRGRRTEARSSRRSPGRIRPIGLPVHGPPTYSTARPETARHFPSRRSRVTTVASVTSTSVTSTTNGPILGSGSPGWGASGTSRTRTRRRTGVGRSDAARAMSSLRGVVQSVCQDAPARKNARSIAAAASRISSFRARAIAPSATSGHTTSAGTKGTGTPDATASPAAKAIVIGTKG